jgi:hypothetical protein
MAIDVLNHMWVCVYSAAYVQKLAEFDQRRGTQMLNRVQVAAQAADIADDALVAYRLMCERQGGRHGSEQVETVLHSDS